MKFFTPQRYVEFNSDDPAIANRADEVWERATADYRRHIKQIRRKLPASVRELAEETCLHDATLLALSQTPARPSHNGRVAIISLQQADRVICLLYLLAAEPGWSRPNRAAPFNPKQTDWLYDEVDIRPDGTIVHEILWSDGRILTLRFTEFKSIELDESDHAIERSTPARKPRKVGAGFVPVTTGSKRIPARRAAKKPSRRKPAAAKCNAAR